MQNFVYLSILYHKLFNCFAVKNVTFFKLLEKGGNMCYNNVYYKNIRMIRYFLSLLIGYSTKNIHGNENDLTVDKSKREIIKNCQSRFLSASRNYLYKIH